MSDAPPPKPGGLWARLFNMEKDEERPATEPLPGDAIESVGAGESPLVLNPATEEPAAEDKTWVERPSDERTWVEQPSEAIPVEIVEIREACEASSPIPMAMPVTAPTANALVAAPVLAAPVLAAPVAPAAPAVVVPLPPCPSCGSPRKPVLIFCDDCGYLFPPPGSPAPSVVPEAAALSAAMAMPGESLPAAVLPVSALASTNGPMAPLRIRERYLLGQEIAEKKGVRRYRGLDAGDDATVPVIIVRAALASESTALAEPMLLDSIPDDDIMPTFDTEIPEAKLADATAVDLDAYTASWPKPGWEADLLTKVDHPAFPVVLDTFSEGDEEFLVLEDPQGTLLWDAWDDPETSPGQRYGWLVQLAEALAALHKKGAMIECLSPDHIVINEQGQVRIANIADLMPSPLPDDVPMRATLYTAPELIKAPQDADARAALYSFGAILYSLEYLHHGLEEKDFEEPYTPRQITDRFPDVHPLFLRVINKTFVKDIHTRFPTDEASRTDPTGFQELIQTLKVCQRVFDTVRLDIAAWTTTGMVRTGNEDALAFLHGVDTRQDDLYEYALVLLCDGMGGYDAGEVAAALAIGSMKKFFLSQPMFAGLAGNDAPEAPVDPDEAKKLFEAGLRHANKEVFTASRMPGKGKRGMGCTAEAVYIDTRHIVVGHVGDSRVYHLRDGRLVQMTRDQTLVNRLVELGQISEAEAEHHPRKNELQQAIGGQPDVSPGSYYGRIKRGDWVLVCSDGLTNHISNQELEKMLTREASNSAEEAARRLLNLVNLRGATDNATVVVVRAS